VTGFLLSLAAVAGVLLVATAIGWLACRALLPGGRAFLAERFGWSFAAGCFLLAAAVSIAFLFRLGPGWIPFLIVAVPALIAGFAFRISRFESQEATLSLETRNSKLETPIAFLLLGLLLFGFLLYALRALTEPMWSNDFLAIWGFKGKTIFFSHSVPPRLATWAPLAFAHPEYPLGLPLLYAGVSFLTGRWDDHAMGLLFPLFQAATLLVLLGWLRRRGASSTLALCAAALVALFEPLYSAFLTGMAEVPLAFGLLLFGTALADALEEAGSGSLRRLAFASLLIAAVKNEGLFLAAAAFAIALLSGGSRRLRIALTALAPALAVYGLHVAWRGRVPLSDFDFTLFSPARVAEALGAAAGVPGRAGWLGVAALAVLIAAGSGDPAGGRLLLLGGAGLGAYLLLPVFAVRGPKWLVETTLLRTASALVPLVAAGITIRIAARSRRDQVAIFAMDPPDPQHVP
jgi:hypothetical protein